MYSKTLRKMGAFLFLLFSCFLIVGCSQEKPDDQGVVAVPSIDKNIAAVQAVLESEFTGPNEEYMRLLNNLYDKSWELNEKEAEGEKYTSDPLVGTPELIEYNEFLKKTYASYFTENAFEQFVYAAFAFAYHTSENYQMGIATIEVVQSDNPNTPKAYDFTVQVNYTNEDGETTQHEVRGMAICSEEGKIGRITFRDDGGLREKMKEDSK